MARKLEVEIVGDASKLNRSLQQSGSSLGKFGKAGALAAGAAGIGALFYAVKTGIGEFAEAQKVTAQTNAVIKSTGQVANVSAKDVTELSESLMKKSGVDDEVIQSGENMLLTFTKIRNEVGKGNDIFKQATQATLDLSVATGKDMVSASTMVGKALQDPVKGITALTRVGVSFTEGQKKTIAGLVEQGKTMQAQKIILAELNREFGGSAEALGNTLPGQINIAKQAFNNLMGELVAKAIPVVEDVVLWIGTNWPKAMAAVGAAWVTLKPTLTEFSTTVKELTQTIKASVQTIKANWGTVGPLVKAVVAVISAQLKTLMELVRLVAALLRGDWAGAWNAAKAVVVSVANTIKSIVVLAFTLLRQVIMGVVTAVTALARVIGKKIPKPPGLDAVVSAFVGLGNAVTAVVNAVERLIGALGRIHVPSLRLPSLPSLPGNPFHRALGGPVAAGRSYIVGERGPELFVPGSGGTIIPNGRGGGGRAQQVNLVLDGRTLASVLIDPLRNQVKLLEARGGSF